MKKIVGIAQMLFGAAVIGGALLYVLNAIASLDAAMGGSTNGTIQAIVSLLMVVLLAIWGGRIVKAGMLRFAHSSNSPQVNSRPQQSASQKTFAWIAESVTAHIDLLCTISNLNNLTDDQIQRLLAFELGCVEWYDRTLLRKASAGSSNGEDGDATFFNLLIYYTKQKYRERAESVLRIYTSMATNQTGLRERELGFKSISDGHLPDGSPRPGHIGLVHLREALGVER